MTKMRCSCEKDPHNPLYEHHETRRPAYNESSLATAIRKAAELASSLAKAACDAVPAFTGSAPMMWLQDTGSGHDLIDRHQCDEYTLSQAQLLDQPLRLNTANGVTTIDESVPIQINPTTENAEALLLDNTPAVMSIGYRCVEKGFGLHLVALQHRAVLRPA